MGTGISDGAFRLIDSELVREADRLLTRSVPTSVSLVEIVASEER